MDNGLVTQLGVGGIFAILVIHMVLKFLKEKKTPAAQEAEIRDSSRERILQTHDEVKGISDQIKGTKPDFYTMRNKVTDIHDVVTAKSEGVPLVYNKGLEKAIERLNNTIKELSNKVR